MKNIKNFKKFNESLEDDLLRIEGDASKTTQFWIERSGPDTSVVGGNATLIDFIENDYDDFVKMMGVPNDHPSMIMITNHKGRVTEDRVCEIYNTQLESWFNDGKLVVNSDSLLIGFKLDLGGANISDYLINIKRSPWEDDNEDDDEDFDYEY